MSEPMSNDPAMRKLVHVLGTEAASAVAAATLKEIHRSGLDTADDRYQFAVALMRRGGVLEAVGRAIKIQALLLGAAET
jgi:hypothetical protein